MCLPTVSVRLVPQLQVMHKTAAAGWPGISLSELGNVEDAAATVTTPVRPSPAASAAADEEMLVSCHTACGALVAVAAPLTPRQGDFAMCTYLVAHC
jgi:hypothetical protein